MEPSSGKSLFQTDLYYREDLVVLNWHGEPIKEFRYYADAYHRAAMALVNQFGTTGAVRDIESTPILFLYRHAFELYLKAFTLTGSKILELAGKKPCQLKKSYILITFLSSSHSLSQQLKL